MEHPSVKQLVALNPPNGSLVIFRVAEDAKKAFMAGCGKAIGQWIENTKSFNTCVLLLSPDASVEELHTRSVLEILERQSKENVEKVMEAWRIAHGVAPTDQNLTGLYALQQQMSKVIDAAIDMKEMVEAVAEDEGRSWPYGETDRELPFDRELKALQALVASVPTQHLAPDEPSAPEPTETPQPGVPETCAVCGAPNHRVGAGYECRNSHGPAAQMRAARLAQLEMEMP